MFIVFTMAAVMWGIGAAMGAHRAARLNMVGLLFVVVLALHVILPDGHPLREATGGEPEFWLLILAFVLLVLAYRFALKRLRGRAGVVEAERAQAADATTPDGPMTETALTPYARHIVLRAIVRPGQAARTNAKPLVVGARGPPPPRPPSSGTAGAGPGPCTAP